MIPHGIINVDTYEDLSSCQRISGKGADVIAELMNEGIETVVFVPKWMADHSDLDPISGGDTLFVVDVKDHSEKAWKVWQPGSQAEFFAKSQARVFQRTTDNIESPQQGLDAFTAGDSR
jgi:hypothetical protein